MQFAIQTRGSWDVVLDTAQWAEQRGVAAIALPDHYLVRGDDLERPAYDHLIHLAALARETTSLELVSLVSPVTFRHPAVLYKTAVTIDEISGGRFPAPPRTLCRANQIEPGEDRDRLRDPRISARGRRQGRRDDRGSRRGR